MKKSPFTLLSITILILLTLIGCGSPVSNGNNNQPPEPPVVEPPSPEPQTKIVAIYNQSTNELGFSDGTIWKYDFTTISSFAGDVVVWGM